ncbi:MAG: aminotransferase class IV [Thermoplasmatota archaeon]
MSSGAWVYLGDAFVPADEARVSIADRGFTLGDGVFETIRVEHGRPRSFARHLERLRRSCSLTRIPFPDRDWVVVAERLARANARDAPLAALRITITRGPGPRGLATANTGPPTVIATLERVEHAAHERARLIVATTRRAPAATLDPRIKSLNYLSHVLARIEADERGATDALLLNDRGRLAEATTANVFALRSGVLRTPSLAEDCLDGITRAEVIATAPKLGVQVEEAPLTVDDIARADEIFLTASIAGIVPVVEVEGRALPRVDEIAVKLSAALFGTS